ncbi:histidine phosphatase family protein [Amycolatopsis mediterranei]|uniref:histidine phosphatase family protein n=1 Tax=Amycolatopsis mediterranei TaxID=33910 RepID=UPI00049F6295|nr:histidine phosphatase family protein [Amycolatopsis mediterranei]KDO10397.1 phosphoglycerate kinase [Amycolatopsis mediterranei]KDU87669.1 phosphoglycerate kinase [Amycolatopsis mediterranei]UZF72288.1 histidine phosphatase family protein [Amycolatopsis mediterranei]
MRSIYVSTHPEATHHVERVVGGWLDSRLTPAGIRAAVSIAETLRSWIPADVEVEVISSDLQRTRRTAGETATVFGLEPIEDHRLRERSYGEAEGRPQEWLDQRFVPPPALGDRMGHDVGVLGAETTRTFARRVYAAMEEILRRPCEHQIIVTHGGTLTFVVAYWIGMPIESLSHVNFRVSSGSITTLREDDYFHNRQVVSLGDTRHLNA